MNISDLIIIAADKGRNLSKDGLYPPGHNGPWDQMETPVRNTCHWMVTNAKAFSLTGKSTYKDLVHKSAKAILNPKYNPFSASYMILNANASYPNGIIGQAWVMEALVAACACLEEPYYLELAKRLALKHHFDPSVNLWAVLTIDGVTGEVHISLNQQLWFGAMNHVVGKLSNNAELLRRSELFYTSLYKYFWNSQNLIHMKINPLSIMSKKRREFQHLVRMLITEPKTQTNATIGYLPFALAPIVYAWKQGANVSEKVISESKRCIQNFCAIPMSKLEDNWYCFIYHPTGFEVSYILKALFSDAVDSDFWTNYQLNNYYHHFLNSPEATTRPCPTLIARFHESTYLC